MSFLKTPQWLKGREGELVDDDTLPVPVPPVAIINHGRIDPVIHGQGNDEAHRLEVITKAHGYVEQIKIERAADRAEIAKLQGELAEVVLMVESEKRKCANLELDLATAANNIQTLQSQIQEMRQLHSMTRQLWDRWEIKAPPKKPRKAKVKAAEKESKP